jgi:hypothetical protein
MTRFPIAVICLVTSLAHSQPSNAVLSWQFSMNDGSTWTPGAIVVNDSVPTSVRVQGVLSWVSSPSTLDIFGAIQFDPFVSRAPEVGASDWIENPLFRIDNRFQPYAGSAVISLPSLLKIDRSTDLLPPGTGPGWTVSSQSLAFGEYVGDNPIVVVDYWYSLDGSPGVRTVSAALWQNGAGQSIAFYDFDIGTSPVLVPVSSQPGTITVIPAPASSVLLVAGIGVAARRRR